MKTSNAISSRVDQLLKNARSQKSRCHGARAAQAYQYILDYKKANDGASPTIQEIADHLGVVKSQALHHVRQLVKKGLLIMPEGKNITRCIQVYGSTWTPPNITDTLHNNGYQNIQDFINDRTKFQLQDIDPQVNKPLPTALRVKEAIKLVAQKAN